MTDVRTREDGQEVLFEDSDASPHVALHNEGGDGQRATMAMAGAKCAACKSIFYSAKEFLAHLGAGGRCSKS